MPSGLTWLPSWPRTSYSGRNRLEAWPGAHLVDAQSPDLRADSKNKAAAQPMGS